TAVAHRRLLGATAVSAVFDPLPGQTLTPIIAKTPHPKEVANMAPSEPESLTPTALRKEGADHFVIDWNDGHHSIYTWRHLRENCPCASCREEKDKPADPLRVLKPGELLPPTAVSMPRVGRYAYKIVWND